MKKLFSVLMTMCMFFSIVGFSSCKDNDGNNSSNPDNTPSIEVGADIVGEYTGGLHECTLSYTNHEFIKNNTTQYKIVIPEEATTNEIFASRELNYFLLSSTGTKMEVITDKDISFDANSQYIFLGKTKYTAEQIETSFAQLSECGYKIKTVEKSIFISGATDIGTINGVYFLLEKCFGYRFYAVDEIKIETVSTLNLPNIVVTDKPDFDYRSDNYGEIIRDINLVRRYRMTQESTSYLFSRNCHNSFTVMPKETYYADHKDWYARDGSQLCYSNEEMIAQYIENLKGHILEKGFNTVVLMGQEDNHGWCSCTACSDSKARYGVDSAVMVKFANRVAREINGWIAEEYPSVEPMTFLVFAYYATNDAPVVWNEGKGIYEAVAPEMQFDKNVGVRYAVPMDYQKTFYDECNENAYEQLKKWNAITDNIHFWSYSLYSWELFVPYNSYASMQTNYKTLLNNGVNSLFDQTKHMQGVSPGFSRLHAFVDTQLMWDVNLSVEELIDEFFPEYFKDASADMRMYFDELRLWYDYLYETTDFGGGWGLRLVEEKYWSKPVLERWLTYTKNAKDSIAYLEHTNKSLHTKLYKRIILEELSIRYILIDLYRFEYSAEARQQMMMDFYNDARSMPIETHEELTTLTDLWRRWDLNV